MPIFAFKKVDAKYYGILFVSAFPIVENFLLSSHAKFYTYANLKLAIPFAIIALLYFKVISRSKVIGIVVIFIFHIGLFHYVNSPFWKSYFVDIYEKLGQVVQEIVKPHQMAFTNKLLGHIVFYAKRNIKICEPVECFEKSLTLNEAGERWYFKMKNKGLKDYNMLKFPYFFGFHNGVIESATFLESTDFSGTKRTVIADTILSHEAGYNMQKKTMLLSHHEIAEFNNTIFKSKQVRFENDKHCEITEVSKLLNFILVSLSPACEVIARHVQFPALMQFIK